MECVDGAAIVHAGFESAALMNHSSVTNLALKGGGLCVGAHLVSWITPRIGNLKGFEYDFIVHRIDFTGRFGISFFAVIQCCLYWAKTQTIAPITTII